MSSSKPRFSLEEVTEEDEIPITPLVSRAAAAPTPAPAPTPMPAPEQAQGREVPIVRATGSSQPVKDKLQRLAEEKFKPKADKRQTSLRLELWLDEALRLRVNKLQVKYPGITREAVITDALIQYLDVTPPGD